MATDYTELITRLRQSDVPYSLRETAAKSIEDLLALLRVMEELEWLRRIAGERGVLFRTEEDICGAQRVVSTNGACLAAVPSDRIPADAEMGKALGQENRDKIASWASREWGTHYRATTEELRKWCDGPLWPEPTTCPDCKGDTLCTHCEVSSCPECGGDGSVTEDPLDRPARLNGIIVNRVLLGRLLSEASDGEVDVYARGALDPVTLWTPGDVILIVMPMRQGGAHIDHKASLRLERAT